MTNQELCSLDIDQLCSYINESGKNKNACPGGAPSGPLTYEEAAKKVKADENDNSDNAQKDSLEKN